MKIVVESALRVLLHMRNIHNAADRIAVRALIKRDINFLRLAA